MKKLINNKIILTAIIFFILGVFVGIAIIMVPSLISNSTPKTTQLSDNTFQEESKLRDITSTPVSASTSAVLESEVQRVEQEGYKVFDPEGLSNTSSKLHALHGTLEFAADGYDQRIFFFYNGKYLGTDTKEPSIGVGVVWRADDIITLSYRLYHNDDPLCCPTGGEAFVRFKWNGTKMIALDPIPTKDWSGDLHR